VIKKLKYIYGPVPSWRLGRSLGVDLLSQPLKVCNFDCLYCQLGKTAYSLKKRSEFVPSAQVIKEISKIPEIDIDYITVSGRGEATLTTNIRETVEGIRKIRKNKIAIITNAALIGDEEVRKDLMLFDFVVAKIDACNQKLLEVINRPLGKIKLEEIIEGFCKFRKEYQGKLAIQTMLIEQNVECISSFAEIYKRIMPDEIQLNTPLRPSPVKPLGKDEMDKLTQKLRKLLPDIPIKMVYEAEKPEVKPLSEPDTLKRRGKV
jgi:wyosine [tRNA(Phe)-imidazoG37] synthetase (radical SAM superfamily)